MKRIVKWIGFMFLLVSIAALNSGCIRASVALGSDADKAAPNQYFGPAGGGSSPAYYPSPYDSY